MDALDALVRGPLFAGLPRERLEPLRPRVQEFPKSAIVWIEGSPGSTVQVVIRGCVKVSRISAKGEELVIQYLLPGELCGLPAALVDGATRMTQGQAVDETVLLSFDREDFLALLEREPFVMRRVLDGIARTARAALSSLADISHLDVRERVAQKLLDLADLYGRRTPEGTRIGMRISQGALAGMVAASREKVNRALGRLTTEGLIRQESGSITILDADRLRPSP